MFVKIGAGIAAFALKGDLKSNIETNMQNGLQYYGNQSDFTNVWDAVQTEFSCCGVTNATNWYPVLGPNNVADSCCIGGQVQGCGHNVTKPDAIFQEGCFTKFSDLFTDNLNIVGGNTLKTTSRFNCEFSLHDTNFGSFNLQFNIDLIIAAVAVGVALVELAVVAISWCMGKRMGNGQYV